MVWKPINKFGVAIHNWHGKTNFGLALDVGDFVEITEEYGDWYRGNCTRKRSTGIFPKSYIYLKDLSKADPVVTECTQVLREWSELWKKCYVGRETYKFTTLRRVMFELLENRRDLLGATFTQDQTFELQMEAISKIDWGNRKLNLDLVPRHINGPLAVDPKEIGIVSLYQVHEKSAENAKMTNKINTLRNKTPKKSLKQYHLYFCMRDFVHRIGDDAEIYFYLYDGTNMKQLSERFVVRMNKSGFASYLNNNCTVFKDLGEYIFKTDLYLVASIMRVGKMLINDNKTRVDQAYRRPFGVGVLQLNEYTNFDNTSESDEKDHNFKVYSCENDKDFYQLHEFIIKKLNTKFAAINGNGGQSCNLHVSLKLLNGGLEQAQREQPSLFQGTEITRKMGFPDVVMPGDVRNDLFITLVSGEYERGGKTTGKNVQVNVSVHDCNGQILQKCLFPASGIESTDVYSSMILYHNNQPNWNETLRLCVPIEKFANAHVRFEFRHCSTNKPEPKIFGFSFARLMEMDGSTLADGPHELYVYKCEDRSKLASASYLKLPCWTDDDQAIQDMTIVSFSRNTKESFQIKSLLCSTKLTQNGDLLSLLQWKNHPEKIQDSLTRVLRLRDEELVKFLQDVLDALFAMFSTEDGNSTEHSGLVFHVLVSIFSLLQSNKFREFKPVIDEYIENHFSAALVYKGLLSSVQHCAEWMASGERPEPIKKCFESLEYIFKLIIQSRKLFANATGGQFEDSFRRDLQMVFGSLSNMLSLTSNESVLPTQIALLNSLSVVMEQLIDVLPAAEIGMSITSMLDSVGSRESHSPLIQAKLQAVKDLVSGKLFHSEETRPHILSISCRILHVHLRQRDELKLCSDILGEILIQLHKLRRDGKEEVVLDMNLDELSQNTLHLLIETVKILLDRKSESCTLLAVLLGLLQQLEETHYRKLWDSLSRNGETKTLKDFLHRSLKIFEELLSHNWEVFEKDWLIMKLSANDVIRKTLEEFAKPLVFRFLDVTTFDSSLWLTYFHLAVTYLTQPCLQLEHYHEGKRRKILNNYGDMRVSMGLQILSMWSQLGIHKQQFIPSMIGPFLEVTLVPEPDLRKATLSVFYDMIQCEQAARGSFDRVANELIDRLDLLISENKGDDEYRELFNTILLEHVRRENPPWRAKGEEFIVSVKQLLERLLDYRSVMQGDENRDKRMTCTVNLLHFYQTEIKRDEMYLRYIYKLHELHLSAENYVEAGFTLKLFADKLSWDSHTLIFIPTDLNGIPEWQRKESIYQQIIEYFDKGKCWEKGIPLCKELANFYETKLINYRKLSEILKKQATFFENILKELRPDREYFRVGFYGRGFPLFVRNKLFVYRGLEYEQISAFTQRLQIEFPTAQIYQKQGRPGPEIIDSNDQYIQIGNLKPIPDTNHLSNGMGIVLDKIAKFYKVNDVTKFKHDRPLYKGTADKSNEFKTLWIERTILEIDTPLPNILRWFEVKSDPKVRELTPVEVACETMENTIRELQELQNQYKSNNKENLNPLTMRLQGTIDANVQGGIPKYQDAFLSDAYIRSPEGKANTQYVQKLRQLIGELFSVLERALDLHGKLAPPELRPLHASLVERLQQIQETFGDVSRSKNSISRIVNTPLPPLPITKAPQNVYEHDELYTPIRNSNDFVNMNVNRNSLELLDLSKSPEAPPVPLRISKTDFNSPEVPPKSKENAPPLPPRGCTPDSKRSSNPLLFGGSFDSQSASGKRIPYSVVDIDIGSDDMESMPINARTYERDSGISTSSHEINNHLPDSNSTNSLPYPHSHSHSHLHHSHLPQNIRGHHKTSSNPEVINPQEFIEMTVTTIQTSTIHTIQSSCKSINSNESLSQNSPLLSSPPAIPPKSARVVPSTNANNMYYDDDESFTNLSSTSTSPPLPPIPAQFRDHCDGSEEADANDNYCVPKQIQCGANSSVDTPCEDEDCEDDCYCSNPPEPCCNNK